MVRKKEISNFSYGFLAVLGAAGAVFCIWSPNGSDVGAGISIGLFVYAAGRLTNNLLRRRRRGADTAGPEERV